MKVKNKSNIFFLMILLGLIMMAMASMPATPISKEQENSDLRFNLESSEFSWNTSDYINFTGPIIIDVSDEVFHRSRIYINDMNPNYTWSKTAAENEWCTGSGTYSDPYVIDNLYIDAQGNGGMILIESSKKYFIVRNCWFNYSGTGEFDAGVCIFGSSNGTVNNNIMTYTRYGVKITLPSNNNTISNNIMISDHTTAGGGAAVHVSSGASNVTIVNNKIRNFKSAIVVMGAYQFTLTNSSIDGNYADNTIHEETYRGSAMYFSDISYSRIVRNVLAGSFAYGRIAIKESYCDGNIIINNTVVVNETLEFGPETSGLPVNNFRLQTAQTTSNAPISLEGCYYNYIAYNVMIIPPELDEDTDGNGDQAIPGFEVFLIIGITSLVSIVLIATRIMKVLKK